MYAAPTSALRWLRFGAWANVRHAELPNSGDIARLRNVDGRIAIDQQNVGSQALRDAAAVVEAESPRWFGRRRSQRLERSEAGADEQFQLVMEAQAVGEAG